MVIVLSTAAIVTGFAVWSALTAINDMPSRKRKAKKVVKPVTVKPVRTARVYAPLTEAAKSNNADLWAK